MEQMINGIMQLSNHNSDSDEKSENFCSSDDEFDPISKN